MGICSRCRSLVSSEVAEANKETCVVCLGLFQDEKVMKDLESALRDAVHPYVKGDGFNRFCYKACPPSISLPGDLIYRTCTFGGDESAVEKFVNQFKTRARDVMMRCLQRVEKDFPTTKAIGYPTHVVEEEHGSLAVYVLVLPKKGLVRPDHLFPPKTNERRKNRKRRLDEDSQGGDPRTNLEKKITSMGYTVWTLNQCVQQSLSTDHGTDEQLRKEIPEDAALEFHVAVWRRPFYLRGTYTKSRRDVSQSPFYVVDDGVRRKLGTTSVEEEIAPVISKHSGGISTLNNDNDEERIVFGMCKFHASGREDMDVRMILPEVGVHDNYNISGRPFVCEVVDAMRVPNCHDLKAIVEEINCATGDQSLSAERRAYGDNPKGVGISTNLCFVPAKCFKYLQAETENKVKYYGCLCWSKEQLPANEKLMKEKLGEFPLQINQTTPIRVLHRRAHAVRTRNILSCHATVIDSHYFRLHLSTDAGTYVKEFVHSDLGRTEPSIASLLGCQTDILELDCEGIQIT